jgi:hypothetical protein
MGLHDIIENITSLEQKYIIIILSILLCYIKIYTSDTFIFTNIIITTLILSIFDVFLKKYLLFNVDNGYYIFIINNIITIVIINLLISLVSQKFKKNNIEYLCYIAFSCLFYELVVFKLYNYNNLCNERLRNSTKTIMRLATIHIISNFLNSRPFDREWFDDSFAQLFNFSMFNIVFDN